jgi:hypothetical protein
MELIPIIKYALTMISGVAFIVVVLSYIMYKVKNSGKPERVSDSEQIITTLAHDYSQNISAAPQLQPVRIHKEPAYINERSFQQNKIAVKKPVQRFMVLNSQPEPQPAETLNYKSASNSTVIQPSTRRSFNIYNNYSANSGEPLHKFSI